MLPDVPTYDGAPVAVIGAGPVGQTAALLLARWGLPVVLLDARSCRDTSGSKAICQQRDVLDVWDSVGAGAQIAEEGTTWTTARTFYRGAELFAWSFVDRGRSPFPPFVNISQARTEAILDQRIAATPAIDSRWAHEVTDVAQDTDGVSLTCRTPAGERVVRASYVIACAGSAGTAIRRLLEVTFDGETFADQFLITDIRTDLPGWASERRFYFDPDWNPGRQVLIHPCPDSTFRIDWQVPPDFDLAAERASGALDTRIRQIVGDRPYDVVWQSVYRFHSRIVDRMRVGRVLLAGDCAHLVAPFGARGLNSGVLDAENAAWKVAFVARNWAPEQLLESYHDERRAAAAENLAVTAETMRFLAPQGERELARRRRILEQARADQAACAFVDSGRLAEPYWYGDSPLTTADPRRPFAGRPPKGDSPPAGPGVLAPDVPISRCGRAVRLRELARTGLLLLVGDSVDPGLVASVAANVTATAATATATATATTANAAPVCVLARREVDPDGLVGAALGLRADEVWLFRPDAHVAAVLIDPDGATVSGAIRRALGFAR